MDRRVAVKTWVDVLGNGPISYLVDRGGAIVDFTFGGNRGDVEFGFDAESLRQFLDVGAEALRQLESAAVSS